MYQFLSDMPKQRWPWLLLAFSAFALELTALFFQYGLKLDPCVMCVYERTAMMGVMFAGLLGATFPRSWLVRLVGFGLWIPSSIWGLDLAITHTDYQLNPSPFATCDFFASYPSWFKLDVWFPAVFNPNGFCDEIDWIFMGWTMPQWLIVVFAVYLGLAAIFSLLSIVSIFKK